MQGVQFVIDERGQQTAVVIDSRRHARVWAQDLVETAEVT